MLLTIDNMCGKQFDTMIVLTHSCLKNLYQIFWKDFLSMYGQHKFYPLLGIGKRRSTPSQIIFFFFFLDLDTLRNCEKSPSEPPKYFSLSCWTFYYEKNMA